MTHQPSAWQGPQAPLRFDWSPKGVIVLCLLVGAVLMAAGCGLAASQYPQTTGYGYFTTTTGSWGGFWAGITMAGTGQMLLFVALIALGVMLGNRASRS